MGRYMKYVYVVYYYQEHGPEEIVATCDKSQVGKMLLEYKPSDGVDLYSELAQKAQEIVDSAPIEDLLRGVPLENGWGQPVVRTIQLFGE